MNYSQSLKNTLLVVQVSQLSPTRRCMVCAQAYIYDLGVAIFRITYSIIIGQNVDQIADVVNV